MATTTRARRNNGAATAVRDAKDPVTPVAGPCGHPFHPILVTVPIGAWVASLVFDIASRTADGGAQVAVNAAYWLIGIGIVGAALAAVFGLLDFLTIPRRTKAFATGLVHMGLNVTVLALFVANFAWRHGSYESALEVRGGQIALSLVALVLLGASGWLGGMLAYRYGVRVATEDDQAEGFMVDLRRAGDNGKNSEVLRRR
jgi:uncharacterized membrane protein